MKLKVQDAEIELIRGDITESSTDAIVNAANSQLLLGAGVAGAIKSKGGSTIQEECNAIGHCPVGEAVLTSGGQLRSRYVIHAVGPRWGEGEEENKLKNATLNSLRRAEESGLTSITFPAISTGVFGFPTGLAARIMTGAVKDYLSKTTKIQRVVFALFDDATLKEFEKALKSEELK